MPHQLVAYNDQDGTVHVDVLKVLRIENRVAKQEAVNLCTGPLMRLPSDQVHCLASMWLGFFSSTTSRARAFVAHSLLSGPLLTKSCGRKSNISVKMHQKCDAENRNTIGTFPTSKKMLAPQSPAGLKPR